MSHVSVGNLKKYTQIALQLGLATLVVACGVDSNLPIKRSITGAEPLNTQSQSAAANTAEGFYNLTLKPALTAKCASCHGIALTGADSFANASTVVKSGVLLKKAGGVGHSGGNVCGPATGKPCAEIGQFAAILSSSTSAQSTTPQPTTPPNPTVTDPALFFSGTLLTKLQSNCGGCHSRVGTAPITILDYNNVKGWITAPNATRSSNEFINRPLGLGTSHIVKCTSITAVPCADIVELGRLLVR